MTFDRPILIPTSRGPIGAIVTEPAGEPWAASRPWGAAVLLEGIGGRRFGPNAIWTRLARSLADEGLVVLRADYPGSGDSGGASGRPRGDLGAVREAIEWFRASTPELGLLSIGVCFGARLAARAAAADRDPLGLALVTPYLRPGRRLRRLHRLVGSARRPPEGAGRAAHATDARVRRDLVAAARRQPIVVISGEMDPFAGDVERMHRELAGRGVESEMRIVQGAVLYGQGTRQAQAITTDAVLRWARVRRDASGRVTTARGVAEFRGSG